MLINHNLNAMNAHRNMGSLNVSQGKSMEKLSSGMRINRASDDAAGLAISEKMRSQIRGLNQASRNAQDGISLIQTAEGALSESQSIAQRMRELAVQSANGTYIDEDRELINKEFNQLKYEMERIATNTEFNGKKLLDGTLQGKIFKDGWIEENGGTYESYFGLAGKFHEKNKDILNKLGVGDFEVRIEINKDATEAHIELKDVSDFLDESYILDSVTIKRPEKEGTFKLFGIEFGMDFTFLNKEGYTNFKFKNEAILSGEGMVFQVGANENQYIGFNIESMRIRELGIAGLTVITQEKSQKAIRDLDKAISKISEQRAELGATQNRLEYAIASVNNTSENLQAAESRIRDVDMAKEMMNLTKLNVLQQASQSMLAQANQAPQQVLSILK